MCPHTTVLHCAPENFVVFGCREHKPVTSSGCYEQFTRTLIGVEQASSTSCPVVVTVRKEPFWLKSREATDECLRTIRGAQL